LFFFSIVVFNSCIEENSSIVLSDDKDIYIAKKWFEEKFLNGSLNQAFVGKERSKFKRIFWDFGSSYKIDNKKTIEIPLEYEDRIFAHTDRVRKKDVSKNVNRLLLIESENGWNVFIIRVMPSNELVDLEGNWYNSKRNDFSGEILYTDWFERPILIVDYENGERIKFWKFQVSPKENRNNLRIKEWVCEFVTIHWYQQACTPSGCTESYLDSETYYVCEQRTYDQWVEPSDGDLGGGEGLGSGEGLEELVAYRTITNNVIDPCISMQVQNAIAGNMTNEIIKLVKNIYNISDEINLTIDEIYDLEDDVEAITDGYRDPTGGSLNIDISFNGNIMPNASKEYILAVLYHEFLHTILFYNNITDNQQHQIMASQYIDILVVALLEHFPNLSIQDATRISWGGLHESEEWKNLDPEEQANIISTNQEYKSSDKGTSC
jgi:hypothetical protein